MGRGDEMRKRKEEKEKWEQEQLLKKAEDAGLTFQDNGLPPPDDEDVYADPGIIKSLLSMIPGTQAYYEAQASEQEMDDLAKIRIEKTKANDLLAMAKMGKHEEALDKMMAETNNDFFYFNKLKERITKEGKYSYKEIDLNPFKDIGSKKNRLRKALRMQFNVLTTSDTLNLSATVEGANDKAAALKHQRALRNSPCSWRGKSKTGVFLQCLNSRHLHPRDTYKDELGNDVHEALTTCAYHAKFCVGDHPGDQEQKILIPNEEALCIECYVDSNQNKPTAMALDKCPGVGPVNTNASKISLQAEEKVDENLTEDSICNWKPTGHEMHTFLRGYKCGNKVYRDPETKVLQYTCAYHIKFCLRTHTSEATSVIEIPNEFGLCTNHHMVEHKDEPVKLKQPYPGMVRRVFKRNLLFKPGHWASPYWPPVGNVEVKHYVKPEYDDVVLLMFAMAAKSVRVFNYYWHRKRVTIIIQRYWRGFVKRNIHLKMKFEATLQRRRLAIPLMQSVGRRYNARKYYIKRRELLMGCVLKIQTLFRGYVTRVYICRVKAAKRIQRLLKRFRIWKFQDAVIMVMQIKIGFRTRLKTIVFIQRVIRGFNARCFVFNKRMVNFLRKRACAIIIRGYRRFVFRRSRLNFQYPTEQWVRDTCGRKLALMLWDMICDRHQRGVLAYYLQQCAPVMQRLVRGFLARRGVKALKYMRKSLRTWCQPEFANEYFRKHLENKSLVFNRQVKMIQQAALETTAVIDTGAAQGLGRNKLEYIRKFLPEEVAKKEEVDLRIALPAINAWYRSIGAPLLETESASLLRRFRNPINNYINITNMDDFISIHKKPCNMHGRTICGDCTFVRECKKPRCKCRKYVSNGHVGGACVHCVHAPFAHRICPSQLKKSLNVGGNTSAADILAEVLDRVRDPDMTIPTTLRGIDMKDAIVQPPEPIDTYHQHLKKEDELYETKLQTIAMQPRGLVRDLKDLRVDGKKMEFVDSYWDQKEINTIEAKAIGVQGSNVVVDEVVPDTTVDPTKFWSEVIRKNPNKNLRHYDETFEHNIPFPIVKNHRLVYTLEGPKLYMNLLLKIISMENKMSLYDDAEFLRLICDHIQMFERHWRKLVTDVREGKLNRYVGIDLESRKLFESTCVPRPKLALLLDNSFRELGFHKKALGKDIKIQSYALRREVADEIARKEAEHAAAEKKKRILDARTGTFGMYLDMVNQVGSGPKKPLPPVGTDETADRPSSGYGSGDPNKRPHSGGMPPSAGETISHFPKREGTASNSGVYMGASLTSAQARRRPSEPNAALSRTMLHAFSENGCFGMVDVPVFQPVDTTTTGNELGGEPALLTGSVELNDTDTDASNVGSNGFGYGVSAMQTCVPCKPGSELNSRRNRAGEMQGKRTSTRESTGQQKRVRIDTASSIMDGTNTNSLVSAGGFGSKRSLKSSGGGGDKTNEKSASRHSSRAVDRKEVLLSLGSAVTGGGELGKLKKAMDNKDMGGPNRRAPHEKRRGSDTDILIPTDTALLQKVYYEQDATARADYHEALALTEGKRFLCPFPACGLSFPSKDSAFAHLPVHEQRLRLGAPTPLPDSHFHFYWPHGAPWMSAKYTERNIPPGSLKCPFGGCNHIFPDQVRLAYHKRLVHGEFDLSHLKKGYFSPIGAAISTPPFEPPPECPILWCPHHITPSGRCLTCLEVENGYGPKPPAKFYQSMTINFKAHSEMIMKIEEAKDAQLYDKNKLFVKETPPLDRGMQERFLKNEYSYKTETSSITYTKHEYGYGLYIGTSHTRVINKHHSIANNSTKLAAVRTTKKPNKKEIDLVKKEKVKLIWQGRPMGLVVDKNDVGWVACEILLTPKQVEFYIGADIMLELYPRDLDRKHELIPVTPVLISNITNPNDSSIFKEALETEFGTVVKWVKMHDVVGKFTLSVVNREDYNKSSQSREKKVSHKNDYFVRPQLLAENT